MVSAHLARSILLRGYQNPEIERGPLEPETVQQVPAYAHAGNPYAALRGFFPFDLLFLQPSWHRHGRISAPEAGPPREQEPSLDVLQLLAGPRALALPCDD